MYTYIWNKYLAVIRILIKRSATLEQTLNLNRIDFEKAGKGRKAGYKFNIEFINGKVNNMLSNNEMAQALANILLGDDIIRLLLLENNYEFSFNTKFQLQIKNCGQWQVPVLPEKDIQETRLPA